MRRSLVFVTCLCLATPFSWAQVTRVSGGFNQDTTRIGEEFSYSLGIRYFKTQDVVFPDSLYNFSPFELNQKISLPTRSDSTYSYDSAIYYFSTFELDTFQYLNLPVFLVTDGDSLVLTPGIDSIVLAHVVEQIPDSVALLANTSYTNVGLDFNYPYLIVGSVSILLIGLIVFFVFGKQIRRKIQLYRMRKLHERFLVRFADDIKHAATDQKVQPVENLINDWKDYMEKLNNQPYTKLTTREILGIVTDKQLRNALSSIDKAIYGNTFDNQLEDGFYYLRTVSEESYQSRVSAIKNG